MERSEILSTMSTLKLYGMKAAYDEILATAIKRQQEPERVVGDLLAAEISEKQARSIKYQMTIAKLPLAKDIDGFVFDGSPINETLVRDLAGGNFLAHQRICVLVGGTGTGKTHLAIAIGRACIRHGGTLVLTTRGQRGIAELTVGVSRIGFGIKQRLSARVPINLFQHSLVLCGSLRSDVMTFRAHRHRRTVPIASCVPCSMPMMNASMHASPIVWHWQSVHGRKRRCAPAGA
jgi:hypothetical protein